MVYMSRMPVGGKRGQSRMGTLQADGDAKRSVGTDGRSAGGQGQEIERESESSSRTTTD